jgi:uncharacterized membrane protein
MPSKLKSRKFWMGVISAVLVLMNEALGWDIPAETVMSFASIVIAFILGEAYVDGKRVNTK